MSASPSAISLHDGPYDGDDSLSLIWESELASLDSFDSTGSSKPYILRASGPWSRDEFARRVLDLSDRSEDEALAYVMNSFPSAGLGRAKLWLIYMKDTNTKGAPFNAFIMDSFRQVDWYQVILSDAAPELVPELQCLPRMSVEACVLGFEPAIQMSASLQLREAVPSAVAVAPPNPDFTFVNEALGGLYTQAQDVIMAWSRLVREITVFKDHVAALAKSILYRYVVFAPSRVQAAVTFLELIARNQSLGLLLVSLSIQGELPTTDLGRLSFIAALRLMPRLRHLYFHDLELFALLEKQFIDAVGGLKLLESVTLATKCELPEHLLRGVFDILPPLKHLHIDWQMDRPAKTRTPPLENLLLRSADTLVSLTILSRSFDLGGFLDDSRPGTFWPHLKELVVYKISDRFPAYSFPNLEQLHIRDSSSRYHGAESGLDPTAGKLVISDIAVPRGSSPSFRGFPLLP
ncbi:hypothetical protein EXIGLDRAFT_769469 [Exidia glandulosa HHB12029]|uniref:Uncharacterized protein n=1 Tax=Exidia glandulosa HHB12029 TaxID=1314781 RepID=A0A166AHQ2_EXIGL|nr:hypothetical protein EXIGLDRAFT_769469 [Exidia glandulosa HHB12029]